ncbi:MAG: cysteine desulfurase [Gemmatimonadota bacterium]
MQTARSRSVSAEVALDIERVRADFPILGRTVHGQPLVYLDNAASSQKPVAVIEAVRDYYETHHANVHRGAHALSVEATEAYETARGVVAAHIGAGSPSELVFVRGATEGLNLVASAWGGANLGPGDQVVLTKMEHHSNLVPWQLLAERTGAELRFIDVTPEGELDLDDYRRLLNGRTKLVGVTNVSNGLGTINPVKEIVRLAHEAGALCLIDGAQAVPHLTVDVQDTGCDFFAFSGHKMCGPTGIGALWSRAEILNEMPPYQGGGEMISEVRLEGSTWADIPQKFEAGTPNVAGAVGLAAAIEYLQGLGMEAIEAWENEVLLYAQSRLDEVRGLHVYGPRTGRTGVFSFTYGDIHPHDLATILDQHGIAIRAGHHCNQPLMDHLGVDATARASFYLYNTPAEVDALIEGLQIAASIFGLET